MAVSDVPTERIAIIGASMSGKSSFLYTEILPQYKYVHYFGPKHNIKPMENALSPYAVMEAYQSIVSLADILSRAENEVNLGHQVPAQLIVFDDFVDTKFIKTDLCKKVFSQSRHWGFSIVMVAHTPNLVITPYIKAQLTTIVLCEYFPTASFEDIIETYFNGMIMNDFAIMHGRMASSKELRNEVQKILTEAFEYKYAKLILKPQIGTWYIWYPNVLIPKEISRKPSDIVSVNGSRRSEKGDNLFEPLTIGSKEKLKGGLVTPELLKAKSNYIWPFSLFW